MLKINKKDINPKVQKEAKLLEEKFTKAMHDKMQARIKAIREKAKLDITAHNEMQKTINEFKNVQSNDIKTIGEELKKIRKEFQNTNKLLYEMLKNMNRM